MDPKQFRELLCAQQRIEEKLDKLLDILALQGRKAPWESMPEVPEDSEPELSVSEHGVSFDDLLITRHITEQALNECVKKWGSVVVRAALTNIQNQVATGKLKINSKGYVAAVLKARCEVAEDEYNIQRELEVKQKALPLMLRQSGAPFQVGLSKVQFIDDVYWINSKRADWLKEGDHYVVGLANKAAWQIRPLTDEARMVMGKFKMFTQTSQLGSHDGRG